MGEGPVISCHTKEECKKHFQGGVDSKKLVVVDFTAYWCGPCRMVAPIFEEIARKADHVIFLKVDVDELKDVAEEFKVEAMPTFLFLKEGEVVDKIVGAQKDAIPKKIQKWAASASA